ncbi:hypothetical protein ACQP2Y_21405 [Actinoplanes sp. CA-051413]|uniref:hypothetical protein n=1 Tax=Actinoplanes sp. CA-051413 TaxID=3239899 RepID=UPI003D9989F1
MAGRNLLASNQSVKRQQEAGVYILGWIAQIMSITAGSYAAGAWPGRTIRWVFELFPAWVIPLALFIGAAAWAIDIISDLTPNQVAITYGFLGPVLAASDNANGTLAARIRDWSQTLQDSFGGQIAGWVGNVGAGALGVALMGVAVIVGKRVLAKQAAAAGGGGR